MDRSSRQKINKETLALNDTLFQILLIGIYRIFYPKTTAHGILSRMDHMLGHKTSLNTFKKIEISGIFSDYKGVRLEIKYKKKKLQKTQIHGG